MSADGDNEDRNLDDVQAVDGADDASAGEGADLIEVRVWIPRNRLGDLYGFTSTLLREPLQVGVPRNGNWTAAQITELASLLDGGALKIMDALAAADGTLLTYQQLADSIPVEVDRLRLETGRITKYSKRVTGRERQWPLDSRELDRDANLGARYAYRLDPVIARWWRAARGDADSRT